MSWFHASATLDVQKQTKQLLNYQNVHGPCIMKLVETLGKQSFTMCFVILGYIEFELNLVLASSKRCEQVGRISHILALLLVSSIFVSLLDLKFNPYLF